MLIAQLGNRCPSTACRCLSSNLWVNAKRSY